MYGECPKCGHSLSPVWFEESETKVVNSALIETGRHRRACSYLTCTVCLNNECVDDTFDSDWY